MMHAAGRATVLRVIGWLLVAVVVVGSGRMLYHHTRGQEPATCPAASVGETVETVGVYILPEDGYEPVLDEIRAARCTIDIEMYQFTDETVRAELGAAINRGITVRIILEEQPYGSFGDQREAFDALTGLGAEVQWGQPQFTYTHAKFLVIDDRTLIVTNQNFTWSGFNANREYGLITTYRDQVAAATAVFDADWQGAQLTDAGPLVVSPINSRDRILDLIHGARQRVWLYAEVLRDEDIVRALDAAEDRGVDVRVLVNEAVDTDDIAFFQDILSHGIEVRVLDEFYVHAKLLLVDGTSALIGSQNYSWTSLNANREVGVILDDPTIIGRLMTTYERDWSRSWSVETLTIALPVDRVRGLNRAQLTASVIVDSPAWVV